MPTPEEEAAAKAAADKKVADDAKAAADKKAADDAAAGGGDETITIKKKDWEKTNSDLENYKTGLLNKKAADRSLDGDGGQGSGNGSGNQNLDEKKVEEIATRVSQKNTHSANEKAAIKEFIKTHADYADDKNWAELLPFLPGKINKDDPAAIIDAMEGAALLHKRSTGKLDEYMAQQADQARRDAEMQAHVNMGFGAGGLGQRTNRENQTDKVPESTVSMGQKFGHTGEQIQEVLKTVPPHPEGGYQIDVTKKPAKK